MNDERKCAHSFRADFSADCASAAAFPRRSAVDADAQARAAERTAEEAAKEKARVLAVSEGGCSDSARREEAAASASTAERRGKAAAEAQSALKSARNECAHFRSSFNYFCSSVAKNVASSRNRPSRNVTEGDLAFVRAPAAELAVELSYALSLWRGDPGVPRRGTPDLPAPDGGELPETLWRRYACGLFATMYAILIDERRRCSQSVLLNLSLIHI